MREKNRIKDDSKDFHLKVDLHEARVWRKSKSLAQVLLGPGEALYEFVPVAVTKYQELEGRRRDISWVSSSFHKDTSHIRLGFQPLGTHLTFNFLPIYKHSLLGS